MIASRKALLVTIYKGRAASVDDYSLSAAMQDIDGYYFAGTLPGAVVATSADATKKKAEAEDLLAQLRVSKYTFDDAAQSLSKLLWPEGDRTKPKIKGNYDWLRAWIDKQPALNGLPVQKLLDHPDLSQQRAAALKEYLAEHPAEEPK